MTARLNVEEAARYTGFAVGTLNNLRTKGGGPLYGQLKKRGRVFYDQRDLDAWLEGLKRRNTRDDPDKRTPPTRRRRAA